MEVVEFIFEFLFQFLFEVVGEFLIDAGYHGTARVLRSRVGRFAIASAAGLGAGLWWGVRLTERGRVQEPRALWISLGLAAVTGLGALWRWKRGARAGNQSVVSPPWRWPAERLVGFAVLNAAVALGIVIGFTPQPLP